MVDLSRQGKAEVECSAAHDDPYVGEASCPSASVQQMKRSTAAWAPFVRHVDNEGQKVTCLGFGVSWQPEEKRRLGKIEKVRYSVDGEALVGVTGRVVVVELQEGGHAAPRGRGRVIKWTLEDQEMGLVVCRSVSRTIEVFKSTETMDEACRGCGLRRWRANDGVAGQRAA